MTQALKEMDDNEFLAKVDALVEHLERQVGDDSVGGLAVSAIGAEIRRRVLRPQESAGNSVFSVPITVEVEKLRLQDTVSMHLSGANFHGAPHLVSVSGKVLLQSSGDTVATPRTTLHVFFSSGEVNAFLLGTNIARDFGIPVVQVFGTKDAEENTQPSSLL